MYSFAIVNNKGGVGKTTMSVSIASQLAKNGKKVLLIDCDPQGNTSGSVLKSYNFEFADVLFGNCTIDQAIMETEFQNLYCIPTIPLDSNNPVAINKLRQYKTTVAANQPWAVADAISLIKDDFDYCIFDTCPAFDPFEENIMAACDEVISVLLLDVFSMDGLDVFKENIADFKKRKRVQNPKFSKLILNGYNKTLQLHNSIYKQMAEQTVFDCFVIPQDQAFKRSQSLAKPVHYLTKQEGEAKSETLDALANITLYI